MKDRSSESSILTNTETQQTSLSEEMVENTARHIPSGQQSSADKHTASDQTVEATDQDNDSDDMNQRITLRAYEIYEQRGGHGDESISDWLQAETEVRGRSAVENTGKPVIRENIDERYSTASSPSKR